MFNGGTAKVGTATMIETAHKLNQLVKPHDYISLICLFGRKLDAFMLNIMTEYIDIATKLFLIRSPCYDAMINTIIKNEAIDCLKWLFEKFQDFDQYTCACSNAWSSRATKSILYLSTLRQRIEVQGDQFFFTCKIAMREHYLTDSKKQACDLDYLAFILAEINSISPRTAELWERGLGGASDIISHFIKEAVEFPVLFPSLQYLLFSYYAKCDIDILKYPIILPLTLRRSVGNPSESIIGGISIINLLNLGINFILTCSNCFEKLGKIGINTFIHDFLPQANDCEISSKLMDQLFHPSITGHMCPN